MESEQRRKAAYPLTKVVFVTAGNKNVESIFLLLPVDCGKAMIIVFIMCFKQGSNEIDERNIARKFASM